MNTSVKDINSVVIVVCTLPNNKDLAIKLIKVLLNLKLAACITMLNEAHSFYYWNNQLENQIELQLLIKTKNTLKGPVFNKIKELHPYKVPELLVIPISNGEHSYLQWIHSKLQY